MNTLEEWLTRVAADLDLDREAIDRDRVLDVTRDVAHHVARPAAPLTAFLIGLAAGRAGGAPDDVAKATETVNRAVAAWQAEHPTDDTDRTRQESKDG